MQVEQFGVVGTGTMGSGIIEVAAKAGIQVVAFDVDAAAIEAGKKRIESSLNRAVSRSKLSEDESQEAQARINWTTELTEMSPCQFVVEAAPESLKLKRQIFQQLDEILAEDAIMATNTSSIPIIDVAMATNRPEQVCGLHFFNPATVMKLVELITTQRTSQSVAEAAASFATEVLGKRVVKCKDRAGFVVNALLVPYLSGAIAMLEAGHATAEDIDTAMKLGAGHPMGPLELCDLIGLDVMLWAAESLHKEYSERYLAPSPLVRRMVAAGQLGRKTGQGFYKY